MSVVQHIRERAGHFRWMGLLVVWAVFIAMAAVLLIERSSMFGEKPRAWLLPTRAKMASRTLKSSLTRFCST